MTVYPNTAVMWNIFLLSGAEIYRGLPTKENLK